jgi:RNA recognition motif-containing protein
LAVRLFIGNLPYGASEADLRAHFSAVAEPSHVVMPVDRETGRPRGFAFVEFAERPAAEDVIKRFDGQLFQGRNLAVSEARAREDRPPPRPGGFSPGGGYGGARPGPPSGGFGGPRPGGGFGGPRPGGGGGFGGGPPGPGGRDRSANFGPPAPPKRLRGAKKGGPQQENRPRGPIKERSGGRIYAVDDLEDDNPVEIDDVATSAAAAKDAEDAEQPDTNPVEPAEQADQEGDE